MTTVNGEMINEDLVKQESERLRMDYEAAFSDMDSDERETQLIDWSRENVIERVLIDQYAKEQGGEVADDVLDEMVGQMVQEYVSGGNAAEDVTDAIRSKMREAAEIQVKVEKVLREVCEKVPDPSEDEIRVYYEDNKEMLKTPEQIRVAHIVRHINAQADQAKALEAMGKVKQELADGGVFELLAGEHSDCPDNGGDLG